MPRFFVFNHGKLPDITVKCRQRTDVVEQAGDSSAVVV